MAKDNQSFDTESQLSSVDYMFYRNLFHLEFQCIEVKRVYGILSPSVFRCIVTLKRTATCIYIPTQYVLFYSKSVLAIILQLDTNKSLVEQCVQGEGMVQINLEVKSQPGNQIIFMKSPPPVYL